MGSCEGSMVGITLGEIDPDGSREGRTDGSIDGGTEGSELTEGITEGSQLLSQPSSCHPYFLLFFCVSLQPLLQPS